ncbi:11671_t:CDS:2 [Paraglomus brasilianum]|uniref:11671_t:CDS:1 n=1 Tax=Paraglomus brasilianum TaxID=144538 RepID=A0A9N9ANZ9_9GLOM|nr:11671_t:CDS:2 [Paraglomus brasilianum]
MSVVCRDLLRLLDSEKNYDVLLCVGEEGHTKEFKAHSLILCARSTYFAAAFGEEWAKKEDNKYILNKPNVTPATMDFILRYLYGGVVDFGSQRASVVLDVLMATDELELLELLNDAQLYIIEKKDEFLNDNPVKILRKIWLHEAFIPLRNICIDIICKQPSILFDCDEFCKIPESILMHFLQRDDLDLPEVFIWRSILEWGVAQNHELTSVNNSSNWTKDDFVTLEKTLHQCLRHVRYHSFQPQEFCESVMPYKKLIPKDIRADIIRYYMVPEKNTPQWKHRSGTKDHSIKIDSLVIKVTQLDLISLWIDTNQYFAHKRFRYELLLRGTRDGFDNATFHNLCDYKGPTLIVCKPSSGNAIIGGYNPLDWTSNGTYGNTDRSFLFHIKDINDLNSAQIARVTNNVYAVYYCASYGPCFGCASDLVTSNTNWSSSTSCYPSIGIPNSFTIQEYEVFKVIS